MRISDWSSDVCSSDLGYRRRVEFAAYDETFGEPLARGVTVLMPAYNEEATIVESVQAMLAMRYPDFEIVVIDDGSKDATIARMIEAFDLIEARKSTRLNYSH